MAGKLSGTAIAAGTITLTQLSGGLNDTTNAAYTQANSAFAAANNRVLKAGDTMTGQLNISSGGLLVTGNVGIGTTNPTTALHITNTYTNASNGTIVAAGNIPGISLRSDDGTRFSIFSSFASGNTTSFTASVGGAHPTSQLMRFDHTTFDTIFPTGKVGITTSSPVHKLHIFTPDGSGDSAIRISTGFSTGTSFDLTVGGNGNYSPGVFAIRDIQTNSTSLQMDGQTIQLGRILNLNANHIRLGYPDTDGSTQGGGRAYYMLAANNFYQTTNAIGLQTNVTHNIGSMVAFKIAGYVYGSPGPFEYMVGFYSGENGIYNSYYSCMPTDLFGEVRVYKRDSDNKLMILFGNTGIQTAVAGIVAERYIHGFYGQDDSFANGWVLRGFTNTTGYTLLNNTTRVDH